MIAKEPQEHPGVERRQGAFERVISPLSRGSFLSEVWGKSFLHLTGQKGRFESLLPWSELNSILEQHRLEPPRLRMFRDGKPVDPSRFVAFRNETTLKPTGLINCLSEGATLILDSVDELAPAVRELVEDFEEVLRTQTTVNLYAGWRTQKGFDLHWDPQDVMILQVSGRKHWKVYEPTRLHPLRRESEEPPRPTREAVWDGILENGDMFYIPRGWWHVAFPLDEPSLHLTLTIVPANGVDLLQWATGQLKRHAEVRMNVPNLGSDAERKRYLARLRDLVAECFSSDELLEMFLTDWEAKIPFRPHFRLPYAPMEQSAPITMETRVRLATSRRLLFERANKNGTTCFHANGVRWECSPNLVPAIERLRNSESSSVQQLCERLPDQSTIPKLMVLLTALAMGGAVWIERAPERGG